MFNQKKKGLFIIMSKFTYKHTTYACYLAYITGAVINNFVPLLFIVFQTQYGLSLDNLAVLIVLNFSVQFVVDFLGAKYVDKIGYRTSLVFALFMAALGLFSLGTLPVIMPPFPGLILSVIFYAIGSGLLEVMVSPTIEGLPADKAKEAAMSLLHSFYCWGSMLVVIVSTIFFRLFGLENWRILCYVWTIIPLFTSLLFLKVPIVPFGNGESCSLKKIISSGLFGIFALLMLCAGAAELAISQWASLFAETGLGVSKTMGDLLGPCLFAASMGIFRALYGKYGDRINLYFALIFSSVICIIGYLVTVFVQNPIVSLIGCGICGFGVAIMWPGTLSLAAKHCAFGGTAIFGYLAMCGDIGCSVGPALVANASERFSLFGSPLKAGLLCAIIFPVILMLGVISLKIKLRKQ